MPSQKVIFRILRYKPGLIEPPRYQDFEIPWTPNLTVLDGLERIRLHQDATLMYRHCCHHASCGTCACTIDGTPALACTTRVAGPDATVTLEPLAHHPCLGDLAVDTRSFFKEMDAGWSNLQPIKKATKDRTPQGVDRLIRLQNCIECGCCVAACPVSSDADLFVGPAVLAAVKHELQRRPKRKAALMKIASDPRGADMCKRHLACSRVCPSQVYPARHIADLSKAIHGPGHGPLKKK